MKHTIYLCGPVTGCSYEECTQWRSKLYNTLTDLGCTVLDPMRSKEHLSNEKEIRASYENHIFSKQKHFFSRDAWDVFNSNLIFANFLEAPKVSIGSVSEIAMAWAWRIPTILVMEEDGNPNDHPFLDEMCGWKVATMDEGIDLVCSLVDV